MKIQAYRIDKLAEKASFKPNDLIECLFEDVGVIFYGDDDENYFVWLEKEDLDELEELMEKYRTGEYEDEEDEEEMDFSEKNFREADTIIKRIKQDLDKDGSVIYIFQ